MDTREFYDLIVSRRSIRDFEEAPVGRAELDLLLKAAQWAPSGMNNQPWRFVTIETRETMDRLAELTKYGMLFKKAPAAVAVFLDNASVYNKVKDIQGVGAALENILLAAHSLGLGACWTGEILNRGGDVEALLDVAPSMELMAVVLVGHPKTGAHEGTRNRKPLENLILGRF